MKCAPYSDSGGGLRWLVAGGPSEVLRGELIWSVAIKGARDEAMGRFASIKKSKAARLTQKHQRKVNQTSLRKSAGQARIDVRCEWKKRKRRVA